MKIQSPLLWKGIGLLGTSLFRNWIGSIDFKWALYEPKIDAAFWNEGRNYILLFWHEHILCPLFFRRHSGVTMLLSQHNDAELVGQCAQLLGMNCVRGSSFRGGAIALKKLLGDQSRNIIAFTPDGPRGPFRQMSIGPVFLASKLQIPIVLLGIGYERPWRMNSWDRFVVPRPFSRGRIISSPFFMVPKEANKDELEHFRLRFQCLLTELTDEAEDWASTGTPRIGESISCMGPKCSLVYYGYNQTAVSAE
ncbi:MAG: lysophospholipid acyltransferase family protein [Thermoguttaceae bacterium]